MLTPLSALGRELLHGLLALLYPGACAACGRALPVDQGYFCAGCLQSITQDDKATCPRCASTVGPFTPLEGGCPECRDSVFHFDGAFRLGPYEGLLRELILRMKHSSGETLAEVLGIVWAEAARERLLAAKVDAVVPVPLHWWRRLRRGYNQSETLARALASALRVPCRPRWLRRIRATPMQTLQTPAGRRENVRGVFRARTRPELRGRTVLLVDDVLTTNEVETGLRIPFRVLA